MSFFQYVSSGVSDAAVKFIQQKNTTDSSQSIVKGFVPKIQGAWIGGDAEEFAADIARRLVPKYVELALAFTGINVNLTKSNESVQGADQNASKMASQLGDTFSQIYP